MAKWKVVFDDVARTTVIVDAEEWETDSDTGTIDFTEDDESVFMTGLSKILYVQRTEP